MFLVAGCVRTFVRSFVRAFVRSCVCVLVRHPLSGAVVLVYDARFARNLACG